MWCHCSGKSPGSLITRPLLVDTAVTLLLERCKRSSEGKAPQRAAVCLTVQQSLAKPHGSSPNPACGGLCLATVKPVPLALDPWTCTTAKHGQCWESTAAEAALSSGNPKVSAGLAEDGEFMLSFPMVYAGHPHLSAAPGASTGMGLWCTQDPRIRGRGSDRGLDLERAQRAARKGEGKACSLQNLDAPTKLWHAEVQAWRAGALHAQHLWLLSAGALQSRDGRAAPLPTRCPRKGPGHTPACMLSRSVCWPWNLWGQPGAGDSTQNPQIKTSRVT